VHAVWDEGLGPDAAPAASAKSADAGEHQHQHTVPTVGGAGRAIVYAVSRDGGATFSAPHVLIPSPGAYQLQPAIATAPGGTVCVAWNEIDQDGKHVVVVRLARPNQDRDREASSP
jgi:hypothetical protein